MTGRNDDRPAFKQMIADSSKGNFDYVLVYKLDRFFRNRYDSAVNKKTLRDNGVKVVSATETISDIPEGVLFESMLEGYNEYYSAELSQKIRRGIRESHKKSQYTGGSIPLGYDLINHKLVINEPEAEIVRFVFNKCATVTLIKDACKELNSKGLKLKVGTPFNGMTISRIINNQHYLGKTIYDEEEYDNIFPKIIDDSLFSVCQNIVKKNKKRTKFLKWHHFLLRGKVFCMNCGLPMHGDTGTSKTGRVYRYYKCNGVKKHLNDCKKYPVKQEELEEYVLDKIKQYVLETSYIKYMSKQMAEYFNSNLKMPAELKLL